MGRQEVARASRRGRNDGGGEVDAGTLLGARQVRHRDRYVVLGGLPLRRRVPSPDTDPSSPPDIFSKIDEELEQHAAIIKKNVGTVAIHDRTVSEQHLGESVLTDAAVEMFLAEQSLQSEPAAG